MNEPLEVGNEWVLSFLDQQNKWDTREDAEQVSQSIEAAEVIDVLEFRGNTMGIEAGERIAEALKKHPELKRALWSDMFTGRMKSEIPPVLGSLCDAMMLTCVRLVELDLSDNAFGPIGAEGIEEFLQSPSAYSLQFLKLNNNGLGAGGKAIARALKQCSENAKRDGDKFCLRSFIAGRNRLEMPGAIALADAFKAIGTLEEINMHQNGINAKGIEALAESFKYNPHLRVINLSDNTFTTIGAKAVAKVLPMLTQLETLHFGDCLCRNVGTIALIESLHPDTHLKIKEINLSGNELSIVAVERVLSKLDSGFNLQSLVLHTNNLGTKFSSVKSHWIHHTCVDLGEESDDQGSLDNEEEEALLSEESGNEGDDEHTEDTEILVKKDERRRSSVPSVTIEEVVTFIRKPTLEAVNSFIVNQSAVIAVIQDELNSRSQDLTSAFLYSLGSLAYASGSDIQAQMNVMKLAEAVVNTAQEVKRWPLSTVDQICNTLLSYGSATQAANGDSFCGDVRGLIFLFDELLKRGYLKTYIPLIKFVFDNSIKMAHPELAKEIDSFVMRKYVNDRFFSG